MNMDLSFYKLNTPVAQCGAKLMEDTLHPRLALYRVDCTVMIPI